MPKSKLPIEKCHLILNMLCERGVDALDRPRWQTFQSTR